MHVLWHGKDLVKAYHDPQTGLVDLVSGRPVQGGEALAVGTEFTLAVDEEGAFSHLTIDVRGDHAGKPGELLDRPAQYRTAVEALVELVGEATPHWSFDESSGSLRVGFEGLAADRWGRVGENLLWLGLDANANIAAIVFEGVSRDPGGKAQAAWLAEIEAAG